MYQLTIPYVEEDILASSLRRHKSQVEELINDLKTEKLLPETTLDRLRQIERGLRRLSHFS